MGVDEKILSNLPRDMQYLLQNCIFNFKKQGIKIQNINLPDLKVVVAAYYILASGEAATNLARFDRNPLWISQQKSGNTRRIIY